MPLKPKKPLVPLEADALVADRLWNAMSSLSEEETAASGAIAGALASLNEIGAVVEKIRIEQPLLLEPYAADLIALVRRSMPISETDAATFVMSLLSSTALARILGDVANGNIDPVAATAKRRKPRAAASADSPVGTPDAQPVTDAPVPPAATNEPLTETTTPSAATAPTRKRAAAKSAPASDPAPDPVPAPVPVPSPAPETVSTSEAEPDPLVDPLVEPDAEPIVPDDFDPAPTAPSVDSHPVAPALPAAVVPPAPGEDFADSQSVSPQPVAASAPTGPVSEIDF